MCGWWWIVRIWFLVVDGVCEVGGGCEFGELFEVVDEVCLVVVVGIVCDCG